MRVLEDNYGWAPIETAPFDENVTVQVTDGQGSSYRLPSPCRRTASGAPLAPLRKGVPARLSKAAHSPC
jgi:hypothetical protein